MAEDTTKEQDAFTTIRIRRFDHDRLSELRRPREAHWEVIQRLLNLHELDAE